MALAWAALTLLGLLALPSPASAQDTTAPTVDQASVGVSGAVVFRFTEPLDQSNLPAASAFTVTADGSAVTVTGVVRNTSVLTNLFLAVSPVIRAGQTVVVTYTDPTAGNDANAIQDAAGNDVASFTTGADGVPAVNNQSGVLPDAPGAPTSLTATANGSSQIDLSWTAPSETGFAVISGYKIESSPDGTSWTDLVANTGNTSTTYAHTGLLGATTRYYRVSAINSAGTSDPSNVDSATTDATAPGAPTGLTATANGSSQIDLSWTAPSDTGGAVGGRAAGARPRRLAPVGLGVSSAT